MVPQHSTDSLWAPRPRPPVGHSGRRGLFSEMTEILTADQSFQELASAYEEAFGALLDLALESIRVEGSFTLLNRLAAMGVRNATTIQAEMAGLRAMLDPTSVRD